MNICDEALLEKQINILHSAAANELYNLALFSVQDQMLAEQLAVDAFASAFCSLPDKSDIFEFRIKSARCLYKALKVHSMAVTRQYTCQYASTACDNFETATAVERKKLIAMLNGLLPVDRFVLMLYYQRFTTKMISRVLCLPSFAAKRRLGRIVRKAAKEWCIAS